MSAKAGQLLPGARVKNKHGAIYEVVDLHHDGYDAKVIDGKKSGGEGRIVWLDLRDFRPGGLEPVA